MVSCSWGSPSAIVHDLAVLGVGTDPPKADAELIVHADAPLARALVLQLLQAA
jgi:hypothetical protein